MKLQPMQNDITVEYAAKGDYLCKFPAMSMEHDGEIIACGGMVELPRVNVLWAVFSQKTGRYMHDVFRATERMMLLANGPVAASVRRDFRQAVRLVEMLGMVKRGAAPEGIVPGVELDIYMRGG